MGIQTLYSVATADINTCIGSASGGNITTGRGNTLIGGLSAVSDPTAEYRVAIGYNADSDQDQHMVIGGSSIGSTILAIKPGMTDTTDLGTGTKVFQNAFVKQMVIGELPTTYRLPVARGTDKQVLQTNAAGTVTWETDGYDLTTSVEQRSTGVISGGVLTVAVGNHHFLISDGTGVIDGTVVSWSFPLEQAWPIHTGILTYVSIDINGDLTFLTMKPTPAYTRSNILIGILIHTGAIDFSYLEDVENAQLTVHSPANTVWDLSQAIGFIKTAGNIIQLRYKPIF
jgi:hypothetical protein